MEACAEPARSSPAQPGPAHSLLQTPPLCLLRWVLWRSSGVLHHLQDVAFVVKGAHGAEHMPLHMAGETVGTAGGERWRHRVQSCELHPANSPLPRTTSDVEREVYVERQ